jgi:hypothetical protein
MVWRQWRIVLGDADVVFGRCCFLGVVVVEETGLSIFLSTWYFFLSIYDDDRSVRDQILCFCLNMF